MWQAVVVAAFNAAAAGIQTVYDIHRKRIVAAVLLQEKGAQSLQKGVKPVAGGLMLYHHALALRQNGSILQ